VPDLGVQTLQREEKLKYLARLLSLPVQVSSDERAAVIPVDRPVRVDHGNDLEHAELSELLGVLGGPREEVEHPLHHERPAGLSWVLPREEYHSLSLALVLPY